MSRLAALQAWLFRLPALDTTPVVLNQRRVYVLPTRAGLGFGAALLVMLLGAINYTLSLGHALVFLLGSLGLVTILHSFRNLAGLSISPGRTEPVFAGQTAQFGLLLESAAPRYAINLGFKDQPVQTIDLADAPSVALQLPMAAPRRGWLRPGRILIETRWPLGLIRAWSYVTPDLRCLVYPAPEPHPPALPWLEGSEGSTRIAGFGRDDFAGLRDYQPSDSPRHIAWKALAGSGKLLTKQFEGEGEGLVMLDWQQIPSSLDVEARLSRLTAWLLEAQRTGLPCGLRLPDFEAAPDASEAHYMACLQALALHGQT